MNEQQLTDFGRAWTRHLRQKVKCFEMAAELFGGGDPAMLEAVRRAQREAEQMPPLAVAVMTLSGWGAYIPPEIAAKSGCVPVLPEQQDIH